MYYLNDVKLLQKAAIFNKERKMLILKRSENSTSRPSKWDLPGGNIDEQDRRSFKQHTNLALESLQREIKEETGLTVKDIFPRYVSSIVNEDKALVVVVGYQAEVDKGDLHISHEHIESQWIEIPQFYTFDVGDSGRFLHEIVSKLKI